MSCPVTGQAPATGPPAKVWKGSACMKLSRLLAPLGLAEGFQDCEISDIAYDSRKACPGCAFVCMRGANSDGHKYARRRGGGRGRRRHRRGACGGPRRPGDPGAGYPPGPGLGERRVFRPPRRGGYPGHRCDRHKGQDHHRLYDPLYIGKGRPQVRGHRHHRGCSSGRSSSKPTTPPP